MKKTDSPPEIFSASSPYQRRYDKIQRIREHNEEKPFWKPFFFFCGEAISVVILVFVAVLFQAFFIISLKELGLWIKGIW